MPKAVVFVFQSPTASQKRLCLSSLSTFRALARCRSKGTSAFISSFTYNQLSVFHLLIRSLIAGFGQKKNHHGCNLLNCSCIYPQECLE